MRNAGSLVEERYAIALSDMAENQPDAKQFEFELGAVTDTISNNRELEFALISPNINMAEKKSVLKAIFEGKVRGIVLNFLYMMLEKDRIRYLKGIYKQFTALRERKNNILRMKIYLAYPLAEEQIKEISNKYKDLYGASDVKADIEVDKSLLGGVKIQIGDKVIDDSVKGRMEGLKKFLSSN